MTLEVFSSLNDSMILQNGLSPQWAGAEAALSSPGMPGTRFSGHLPVLGVFIFSALMVQSCPAGHLPSRGGLAQGRKRPWQDAATRTCSPGLLGTPGGQRHLLVFGATKGIAAWAGHRL